MEKTEKEFEDAVAEYIHRWFPDVKVRVKSMEKSNDEPVIQCETCINSILKSCRYCDSEKRQCVLLDIDVDDDFYCKMWATKWLV